MSGPADSRAAFVRLVRSRDRGISRGPVLLLLPAVLLTVAFFILPFMRLLRISFYEHAPGTIMQPGFTVEHYVEFVTDPFYLNKLWLTLWLGVVVTLAALSLGYPVAYVLARVRIRQQGVLIGLLLSPLLTNFIVLAFAWIVLLSDQGVINRVLQWLRLRATCDGSRHSSREEFVAALWVSLKLALIATALGLVVGTLAAYGLFKVREGTARATLNLILFSPLIFPEIIIAVALLLFLSERGLVGGITGLVIAHLVIIVPLVIQTVTATLAGFRVELEEAASSLGAGPVRAFLTVTLPLIRSGVVGAAIFSFLFSFNDAVLAVFLRGPGAETLPVQMFAYIRYQINPLLGAASTLFIAVTVVVIVLFVRLVGFESIVGLGE